MDHLIYAELAAVRRRELLRDAESSRLARRAAGKRPGSPAQRSGPPGQQSGERRLLRMAKRLAWRSA